MAQNLPTGTGNNLSTQTENALMKIIIKQLVVTLIDVLAHAPNLSTWKSAYFIMQIPLYEADPVMRNSKEEKYDMFAARYKKIITTLEDAALYLDGNEIISAIQSLEKFGGPIDNR
jgi:hypothetical protein